MDSDDQSSSKQNEDEDESEEEEENKSFMQKLGGFLFFGCGGGKDKK